MKKVLLVGANHAGIAAANTLIDNYSDISLTIIDRNTNLSYLGCGTALWVGKQIDGYSGLFYTSAETFEKKGVTIHMETVVKSIDFNAKKAHATKSDGSELVVEYDKLILATGSIPISPNIPGKDLANIQFLKLFQDGEKAIKAMEDPSVKNVAIIGAGYIGVEIAEASQRRGKNVYLLEAESTSLASYYDEEFSKKMDENLEKNGINLCYGQLVTGFKGGSRVETVVTNKGEYSADLVFMSIGFRPNNELGKESLELIGNGAYKVNLHQETSLKDVYAIGDCASLYSNAIQDTAYIALATNAVRSGIVAGHNIGGTPIKSLGVQGSNGISIFGYNMVSTGLSVKMAEKANLKVSATDFEDLQRPAFMKENNLVKIRIVYETESRRVVGAQLASNEDISGVIHMFSLAIAKKVTIEEIALLDIFFLPHFNQPYNYITMAALTAK